MIGILLTRTFYIILYFYLESIIFLIVTIIVLNKIAKSKKIYLIYNYLYKKIILHIVVSII